MTEIFRGWVHRSKQFNTDTGQWSDWYYARGHKGNANPKIYQRKGDADRVREYNPVKKQLNGYFKDRYDVEELPDGSYKIYDKKDLSLRSHIYEEVIEVKVVQA